MPERKVTTDHAAIRRWVEERQGRPTTVRGTGGEAKAGVLRIEFPGHKASRLEELSWEEFFRKFDEKGLAFLHQELTSDGKPSRYCKFVRREQGGGGGSGGGTPPPHDSEVEDQSRWEGESPAASRVPGGSDREDQKPSIGQDLI